MKLEEYRSGVGRRYRPGKGRGGYCGEVLLLNLPDRYVDNRSFSYCDRSSFRLFERNE